MSLPVWALLAFVCITGTLCVISQEITWLVNPAVRAMNPDGRPALPFSAIENTVQETYPAAHLTAIRMEASYLAYRVRVVLPGDIRKELLVNQYTGALQGEVDGTTLRGFLLALHGWLLFPWQDEYSVGWYVVTLLSIPLLGALVTGLVVYKHFWRVLYRPRLRLNKGDRVLWGDVHRLLAGWSLWFIPLIALSGAWFLISGVLAHNRIEIYPPPPALKPSESRANEPGDVATMISLDTAVESARKVYPQLAVSSIQRSPGALGIITLMGKRSATLYRDNANVVHVHPVTAEVVAARGVEDLNGLQTASALLVPLHFGDFAGLAVKLLWFASGCLLSLLVCSGFIIWYKRTRAAMGHVRGPAVAARLGLLYRWNWPLTGLSLLILWSLVGS